MTNSFKNMMNKLKDTTSLDNVSIYEHNKLPDYSCVSYSTVTEYSEAHKDTKFASFLTKVTDSNGTLSSIDEIMEGLFEQRLVGLLSAVKYRDSDGNICNIFSSDMGKVYSEYKSNHYSRVKKEIEYLFTDEYKKHPNYKLLANKVSDPKYIFSVLFFCFISLVDEDGSVLHIHTSNFFDKETNLFTGNYAYELTLSMHVAFRNEEGGNIDYIKFDEMFPDFHND